MALGEGVTVTPRLGVDEEMSRRSVVVGVSVAILGVGVRVGAAAA